MGVLYNKRTKTISYLYIVEDEEDGSEEDGPQNFSPNEDVPRPFGPTNQVLLDYMMGFRLEVIQEIGELKQMIDRMELQRGDNDGVDMNED